MANDNNKKSALKSTAEVVATTSTILVAGKTIATVVDSTATSVKDMYAEIKTATSTSDAEKQEVAEGEAAEVKLAEAVAKSVAENSSLTDELIENVMVRETLNSVRNTPQPVNDMSTDVSDAVGEITNSPEDVALISTEPLEEDTEQWSDNPEDYYGDPLSGESSEDLLTEVSIPIDPETEEQIEIEVEPLDLAQEPADAPSCLFEDADNWVASADLFTDAVEEQPLRNETTDDIV